MRPLRPFCGTVLKAQLLTLPATISTSAKGVVTTQLSFLPPASSSATEVWGSSESRPATAQPPEPPPTTTKSKPSVMRIPKSLFVIVMPCWLSSLPDDGGVVLIVRIGAEHGQHIGLHAVGKIRHLTLRYRRIVGRCGS